MFVTSLNQADPDRPSFFEVMAQEQLMPALKPALRYVLSVVSLRNPRLEWFVKHLDEVFYLGLFLLESRFLKLHDASFSENFYGLQRVRRVPVSRSSAVEEEPPKALQQSEAGKGLLMGALEEGSAAPAQQFTYKPLRPWDRWWSLFFLVLLPYLKSKADDHYKRLSGRSSASLLWSEPVISSAGPRSASTSSSSQQPDATSFSSFVSRLKGQLRWLFVLCWPYVNALYEGLFFVYQLLYMYDYTRYYTPFLHLMGVEHRRLSLKDLEEQDRQTQRSRRVELRELAVWSAGLSGNDNARANVVLRTIVRWATKGRHLLEDYGRLVLPLSVFLFKFLEWWYSNENLISPPKRDPIPPPPELPDYLQPHPASPASEDGTTIQLPKDRSECPLCHRKRTIPACISSSGLVFCYACIHRYVSENGRCPVSGLPTSLDQIFHIYD